MQQHEITRRIIALDAEYDDAHPSERFGIDLAIAALLDDPNCASDAYIDVLRERCERVEASDRELVAA